jgi:hypothetical protein
MISIGLFELTLLIAFLIAFISAVCNVYIAKSKGRSSVFWSLMGLFFSLIATAILLILPARESGSKETLSL